jgi:hypothetical protein
MTMAISDLAPLDFGSGLGTEKDWALTGPHPEDPDALETFVVWLHDAIHDTGVELRIHAKDGVAEGRVVVFLPDGRILHAVPEQAPLTKADAPESEHVKYRCLEAFRHWEYRLVDLPMTATTDQAHENGEVEPGPEVLVSLDFDARTVAPAWIQGSLLPEAREAMLGPVGLWIAGRLTSGMSANAFRYDQALAATGTITVDGVTSPFDGYGLRGHVRGVRIMDGFKAHTWIGAVFPESGTAVGLQCHIAHGTPGGYAFSEAYVWREGVVYPNRIIYAPPVSRQEPHAEFVVELACDELGLTRVRGRDTRVAWTSMGGSGLGQAGARPMALNTSVVGSGRRPDALTVMSQALTTFDLDGESGMGMCERSG